MRTDIFPINYFISIWTPRKAYKGRHPYKWPQIIIILLFINSLLLIPVSLNFAKMETFPMEGTFPNGLGLIDDSVVPHLDSADFSQGKLHMESEFYITKADGVIGGNLSSEQVDQALEADNALLFLEEEFILKEGEQAISSIPYTKNFSLEGVSTAGELKETISEQWFIHNKVYIVASLTFSLFMLTFVSLILIVFGSSLFLYVTKKSQYSSIGSYKESVNFILNLLGLPTVIAMLYGLFNFDIIIMLLIQSFGLVFMLLAAFYQTRLTDSSKSSIKAPTR